MHDKVLEPRASFSSMMDSTREDWHIIVQRFQPFAGELSDRILGHLQMLGHDHGGFAVTRLHHSLLTATLAHKAGEDEEYVVCALLHDIGDMLASWNHPDIAVAILKPFVSEENLWMVEKHGVFQSYYFFHHIGMDRHMREQFRRHPYFERTEHFCEAYDNRAFDSKLECAPLEFFEPMMRRLFATLKNSSYREAAQKTGLAD